MKNLILLPLIGAGLLLNSSPVSAYHVIKQHREPAPVVEQAPVAKQVQQAPVVSANNKTLTASATARTDRALLSEDTPASVYADNSVQNSAAPQATTGEYLMRSGDQLQIVVYGHEDLSTRPGVSYTPYVVRPDGKLAIPLIGDVNCQGRPVPEVTQEITNRLAEYIIDPQVTINITKLGTTRVYVLGEVNRQGTYELEKSHCLIDAVGAAGGFTQKAAKRKVFVARKGMDNFVTQVNLVELMKYGNQSANIELQEGDCVYIGSNHKINVQQIFTMAYYVAAGANDVDDIKNR